MTDTDHAPKGKIKKVSTPYLAQKKYLAAQEAQRAAGEPVTAPSLSLFGALKWLVIAILANFLLSRMITESWFWTYTVLPPCCSHDDTLKYAIQGKLTNIRNYIPQRSRQIRYFTESELAQYDGTDVSKPILIGLDGHVYDVSAGRRSYGPGGSYHHFAGRDGARAFVTGCFQTHLTHDLRGLDKRQLESLGGWKQFYAEHGRYFRVGTVLHEPIDPTSPVPADCNAKAEGGAVD